MWIEDYSTMRQTRWGSLDDAFAVTVFELLSATAGAGFVASGQLVLDNGLLGYLFAGEGFGFCTDRNVDEVAGFVDSCLVSV